MFISVPYAFGNMQQGELFGTLFFVMVVLAALGTVVALVEPIVSFLRQQLRCTRLFAVFLTILAAWWLCLALALSFNIWDQVLWFGKWNLFQFLDHLTAQWLLPLVSLGLVIFVGWRMRPAILREELYRESDVFFSQWLWWLRYIAPAAIIAVFVIAKGQ
jgi:NSS family neurotransmitter:Na+ symporter